MRSSPVVGKTAGDWPGTIAAMVVRSLRSKMCLSPFLSSVAIAAVLLTVAGCSSNSTSASSEEVADYSKVRTMVGFYEGYLSQNRSQPPANEQAFRDYLNKKQDILQKLEISVDAMFASPRDGKPLKWVYGRRPPVWRQNNMTCYAYEAEPVAGKRLVIGGRGMFAEVDEAQFRTLFPNTQ